MQACLLITGRRLCLPEVLRKQRQKSLKKPDQMSVKAPSLAAVRRGAMSQADTCSALPENLGQQKWPGLEPCQGFPAGLVAHI